MHDKALKVFDSIQEAYIEHSIKHNNYAEANFWTFIKHFAGHSLDKTQFTKHYISDTKNGYCLTEFIDPDIHKTTSPINYVRTFGLDTPNDCIYNPSIMGKLYDGGGYTKGNYFTSDKIVIRYFKKLSNRSKKELPTVLANIEALAQNPKTPHRDKIQQAIDLFKY